MADVSLERRLAALSPPDINGAQDRALAAIRGPGPRSHGTPALRAERRRLGFAVIAASLFLTAGTLLTAPGHALTSWVGKQLGLGEPGGHPTLRQLGHFARKGTVGDGQAAYVLARGPAPYGDHYELITYRSNRGGHHCFELDLPGARSLHGGGCEESGTPSELAARSGIVIGPAGGGRNYDRVIQFVSGRVSDDIDAVHVAFNGRPARVELKQPPSWLLDKLGFDRPFKFFIAFVGPEAEQGGTISTNAARDGVTVAHGESLVLPNMRRAHIDWCLRALELAEEGKLSDYNAKRTCRSGGVNPNTAG